MKPSSRILTNAFLRENNDRNLLTYEKIPESFILTLEEYKKGNYLLNPSELFIGILEELDNIKENLK